MTLNKPLFLQALVGDAALPFSAQEVRTLIDALTVGVGVCTTADLAVVQRAAGANFTVDVAAGRALISGTSVADQGKYAVESTATTNLTIAGAPGAGLNRLDLVYAQVRDRQADGGANYDWQLAVVTGTVTNVLPTLPANAIPLAQVGPVVTGTASITNSLITDLRTYFTSTGFISRQADVASSQTTTSTSYTNLTTVGPQVTVPLNSGQQVAITIACRLQNSVGTGFAAVMSWDVSGQATQAAADGDSVENDDSAGATMQRTGLYTAPSTGIYTFTAKYKVINSTTGTFINRRLIVARS